MTYFSENYFIWSFLLRVFFIYLWFWSIDVNNLLSITLIKWFHNHQSNLFLVSLWNLQKKKFFIVKTLSARLKQLVIQVLTWVRFELKRHYTLSHHDTNCSFACSDDCTISAIKNLKWEITVQIIMMIIALNSIYRCLQGRVM